MRTLILVCLVALVVAVGIAFAVGLVGIATDHPEGRYIVSLTVNTSMICPLTPRAESSPYNGVGSANDNLVDVKGKVIRVRPEINEFDLSESIKSWTFQLAKDGKVFINDRESKLADVQAGDDATVTFDRQGQQFLASVVRCTRN
jgi:hypothetical protein